MKRLFLILVLFLLVIPAARANDGTPAQGAWPIPAEHCTWDRRGVIKWIHDAPLGKWIKYRCICVKPDIHSGCRWELIDIRTTKPRYEAKYQYNGQWYWKPGWHGHRHWVGIKMSSGGWCFYFWPTWHYRPERLR